MPELDIKIVSVEPAAHAAVPTLFFKLTIGQGKTPVPIQSISLQCQIRIDARKRLYKPAEKARLSDLFGEPERWSQTLHNMLWTHATMTIPAFEGDCEVNLPVPCSFDFNVAATKYFHGLEFDAIPLLMLFSGSVFYRDEEGALAMELISWSKESNYRLPIAVWQDMMEIYYPNQTWLCVNRQVFEALYEYKRRHGYTGFDEVLTSLLPEAKRAAS
ncbi:MAG: DUF6084 family protein [Gammaproteobacteria bacterium]